MTAGHGRRGLVLAVVGCVTAAAIVVLTSGQTWLQLSLDRGHPLPPVSETYTGVDVLGPLVPIGILLGAAALALLASGRVGRLVVGVVLFLAGALIVLRAGFFLEDEGSLIALDWVGQFEEGGLSLIADREVWRLPAVFALIGGGIAVSVGVFAVVRGRRWPVMGTRFDRRSRTASGTVLGGPQGYVGKGPDDPNAPIGEAAMWAAMDRGEDPTSISSTARPADPRPSTRDAAVPRPSLE